MKNVNNMYRKYFLRGKSSRMTFSLSIDRLTLQCGHKWPECGLTNDKLIFKSYDKLWTKDLGMLSPHPSVGSFVCLEALIKC